MRMDLPQCNLKTCRYSSDGNCTDKNRFGTCEYSCVKQENTKLKVENGRLKENIIDSANDTYSMQKLDHELLTKEIGQLKSDLERSYSNIKGKIVARRWNITSDCTPIECMYMQWANRMNDWCVEIVERALKGGAE